MDDISLRDPSRTGAVWVAGTGAFLLLVAAATFIAVRWDDIPHAAKLAAVGALTGGFLLAGRALRPSLPATSGALFHLGAFLIPVDVAAVSMHLQLGWEGVLLAEGLVSAAAFAVLDAVQPSPLLRRAATAAVVALAGGVGAVTSAPAGLALAAAAATAELARRRGAALTWALVAGGAPALALAENTILTGRGVLDHLGLTGEAPGWAAVATGLVAAVVIGRSAVARRSAALALVGVGVAGLGLVATWVELAPSGGITVVGVATLFALSQAAVVFLDGDPFWHRPADLVQRLFEAVGLAVGFLLIPAVLLAPTDSAEPMPEVAVAGAIVVLGWVLGHVRRTQAERDVVNLAAVVTGVASLAIAGAPPALSAIALAAGGIAVLLAGPAWAVLPFTTYGALTAAASDGRLAAGLGLLGGLAVATLAVRRQQRVADGQVPAHPMGPWLWAAASFLPPIAGSTSLVATDYTTAFGGLLLAVGAAWLLAAVLDLAPGAPLGLVGRVAMLTTLAFTEGLDADRIAVLAGIVAGLTILDAVRLGDPRPAFVTAVALPVATVAAAVGSGLTVGYAGVALCALSVVVAGLSSLVEGRWRDPFLACVGLSAGAGLLVASTDAAAMSDALLLLGGLLIAAGIVERRDAGTFGGGLLVTAGIFGHLYLGGVGAADAYAAPVAALLLAAGWRARGTGVSSWVAYAPPAMLLGGAALADRFSGDGAGIHAVVAGTIGVVAVMAGGWHRLAGPLVTGTAILLVLTGRESLVVTASVPTWGWLALAGTVLLAAGVALERTDTGPVESGRRLVDVLSERFD